MSRVQLALNVTDIDEAVSFYTVLFGTEPAKRQAWLRQLCHHRAAAQARPAREPRPGRHTEPPRHRSRQHRRGRRRAGPARPGRPGRRRRARHHLLLRPAGQVLGHRIPRRRTLGDLHRPGRQRHLLGPGQRTALGRRPGRTRRRTGGAGHPVLRRPAGHQRGRRLQRLLRVEDRYPETTAQTVGVIRCQGRRVALSARTSGDVGDAAHGAGEPAVVELKSAGQVGALAGAECRRVAAAGAAVLGAGPVLSDQPAGSC